MSDAETNGTKQGLREIIRWKEQSESFLLGVIVGSFAVMGVWLLAELVRSVAPGR